jgi:hypothetical protein
MRAYVRTIVLSLLAAYSVYGQNPSQTPPASDVWAPVSETLGRQGRLQPDGAYILGFPRPELNVTIQGLKTAPILGAASSLMFSAPGDDAMMMGDLVLTQEEIAPVVRILVTNGINVTALHNHFNHETPRLMYCHIEAHGNALRLAQSVKGAITMIKSSSTATAALSKPPSDADVAAIEGVLGHKGRVAGGGLVVSVPRPENVLSHGMKIPASMGVSCTLLFQPLGEGTMAIAGDIVLLSSEVNPVVRALTSEGIEVTAIHSHMLDEEPRLFFLHFWANDELKKLVTAVRRALDETNMEKKGRPN